MVFTLILTLGILHCNLTWNSVLYSSGLNSEPGCLASNPSSLAQELCDLDKCLCLSVPQCPQLSDRDTYIYVHTHTHNRFSLLADSAICRLAYLLKCIWNLKISTPCGTFTVIHGQACSQLRMNKAAFGLFLSVLIL